MAFLKDFKSFLMKGDIVALATAVIIGGAFNKIVGSLVKDVIMPVIGVIMGGKNVNNLFFSLDGGQYDTVEAAVEAGGAIMTYGNFLQPRRKKKQNLQLQKDQLKKNYLLKFATN